MYLGTHHPARSASRVLPAGGSPSRSHSVAGHLPTCGGLRSQPHVFARFTRFPDPGNTDIRTVTGPPMIRSEDGQLVGFVFVDTDRPIADYVKEARSKVDTAVDLPSGVRLAWVGQYRYFERAKAKLKTVVP